MRAYDNAQTVADENQILSDFQKQSQRCYQRYHHIADIPYDLSPRATLDLFPCTSDTTVIFIHGGYWQWCEKSDFAFIAEYVLLQNMQCVLLEYDLAPRSRLSQMNLQMTKALDFIQQQDWITSNVIVVGHSAGAHLTALNIHHPRINSAVLLSGIYDLQPIQSTHLNLALNLNESDIQLLSPIHIHTVSNKPCYIAYGSNELDELQWQSQQYFEFRKQLDPELVHLKKYANTNHYSILERYFKYEFIHDFNTHLLNSRTSN